ncbi:TlpA family protein disulfide reductase [Streptomyces gobiensis]|uniref:TlpA family protein disulfide reductase n=1 Tax=Streptomyces gobiensis TaxID=2875706 RepID=UPI001E29E400|nr:TlpA disulfide reductase family protein [Streptomyces gobiensis]UGY91003.1 TlpA family protein disulfide reductase [Streptomyces gobiensis]
MAIAGLLALTAGTLTACGSSTQSGQDDTGTLGAAQGNSSQYFKPGERTLTPTLKGTTLDGGHEDISDMRGDVVVINVWGSWCAPCRKEAPELVKLHEETTPLGVEFLGIDIRDNKAAAKAFERNYGITYPSIYDPEGRTTTGFKQLAPRAVPTTYVLDRTGRVAALSIGALTYRGFAPIIKDIAAEKH